MNDHDDQGLYVNLCVPSGVTLVRDDLLARLTQGALFAEADNTWLPVHAGRPVESVLRVSQSGWAARTPTRPGRRPAGYLCA